MRPSSPKRAAELAAHGLLNQLLLAAAMLGQRTYCNRTATWLIRTGTQWTKRYPQISENPLNKPDFRTQ
jgi:hypothetical protein